MTRTHRRTVCRVGDRAPAFRAPTSNGQTLDQDAFVGKLAWAMFFLPAAWTERDQWAPEAEIALAELDELLVEFGHLRVQLLGAARTTPRVARDRHDRDQLAVTLLADEDGTIARRFTTAEPVPASALRAVVVDRTGVVAGVLSAGEATGFPRTRARRVPRIGRGASRSHATQRARRRTRRSARVTVKGILRLEWRSSGSSRDPRCDRKRLACRTAQRHVVRRADRALQAVCAARTLSRRARCGPTTAAGLRADSAARLDDGEALDGRTGEHEQGTQGRCDTSTTREGQRRACDRRSLRAMAELRRRGPDGTRLRRRSERACAP